ncbi:MAG: hypothetical protein AAGH78_09355 [Cyanobacteria bacterium P01_H01_bin.58]
MAHLMLATGNVATVGKSGFQRLQKVASVPTSPVCRRSFGDAGDPSNTLT